jgi:hypothetical protein
MHEVLPTRRQAVHKPLICPTGQVRSGSKSVLVGKSGDLWRTSARLGLFQFAMRKAPPSAVFDTTWT